MKNDAPNDLENVRKYQQCNNVNNTSQTSLTDCSINEQHCRTMQHITLSSSFFVVYRAKNAILLTFIC